MRAVEPSANFRGFLHLKTAYPILTCKGKEYPMRITSKGQVTIPAEIRAQAGLLPHTEVVFEFDGKAVGIVRAKGRNNDIHAAPLLADLRRRGDLAMITVAIMS